MNFYKALRIIALRDVVQGSPEYRLRYIYRWYSRTFHVPLPEVLALDPEDVLMAYYETQYEEMTETQRREEMQQLVETEEGRRKRLREKDVVDASDVLFHEQSDDMAAQLRTTEVKKEVSQKKIAEATGVQAVLQALERHGKETSLEPSFKVGQKLPPSISMKFASPTEFEALLDRDSPDMAPDANLLPKPSPRDPE